MGDAECALATFFTDYNHLVRAALAFIRLIHFVV